MEKVRVDRWLWSVRIFKSRTLATKACKKKKVHIDGNPVKPSYLVTKGEKLFVKKNGFDLQFLVKELINKRVSAPKAAPCYDNITPEEELNKYKNWYIGKGKPEIREKGIGRPTKKERREIEEFKEEQYFYDMWDDEDEY